MTGLIAFVLLAINPIGGLLAAIPFAVLKLDYPAWAVVVTGVPLAYLQVVVVDLGWTTLERWSWWRRLIERSRGKWAQRLIQSGGNFWVVFLTTPILGPWLVMGLMRWMGIRQPKVVAPILLALLATSVVIAWVSVFVPTLFD